MHLLDNGSQGGSTVPSPQAAVGTPGYAASGTPGTYARTLLDPDNYNSVLAELINVVLAGGLSLDRSNNAQLLGAINAIVQVQAGNYAQDIGSVNAISVFPSPVPTPVAGLTLWVRMANTNTGNTTIMLNGGGTASVTNVDGTQLVPGQLHANGMADLTYNGSGWQLTSASGVNLQHGLSFITSGSGTFTVPGGVYTIDVQVEGSGAGGGGCAAGTGAAGGGAGGGAARALVAVSPGQTIAYVVDAGGSGGTPGNGGNGGGTTYFGPISSTGGSGGQSANGSGGTGLGGATPGVGSGGQGNFTGGLGLAGETTGGLYFGGAGGWGPFGNGITPGSPGAANGNSGGRGSGGSGGSNGGGGGNGGPGMITLRW